MDSLIRDKARLSSANRMGPSMSMPRMRPLHRFPSNEKTSTRLSSPVFLRAVFVLNLEAATSVPELRGAITEWLEAVELNFRTLLTLGVEDGSVRADVDVNDKAHELLTLSLGAAYLFVLNPAETDPGHILRRALEDVAPEQ